MFNFLSARDTTLFPLPVTTGNNRINSMPIILAGPMLRHVSSDIVSVWLATRQSIQSQAILQVFDESGSGNQTPVGPTTSTVEEFQLGDNLYISVITCKTVPNLAFTFLKNKIYSYNIKFSATDDLNTPGYLSAAGSTTGGMSKIIYPGFTRPTFALAPSDLEQTNIVHSSCRKPHAEGQDALSLLSTNVIAPNITSPINRPHLLLLTGDQIYADDVAELLLFMLDDASKALLGWVEQLPNVTFTTNTPTSVTFPPVEGTTAPLPKSTATPDNTGPVFASLAPGERQNAIYRSNAKLSARTTSGLTSDAAASHLMRLGEFYAMYLFAWSDELWGNFTSSDEAWQVMTGESVPTSTATETEKERFFKFKSFSNEFAVLQAFKQDLVEVRRALANVPTYMICDDHEVTDDWFLNLTWAQKILGDGQIRFDNNTAVQDTVNRPVISANPLGSRIMLNGMAAYVAFQDWGNRPQIYTMPSNSTNKYWRVINGLQEVHSGGVTNRDSKFETLKSFVLPVIKISRLDQGVNKLKDEKVLDPVIRLDYKLQFFNSSQAPNNKEFQIIFLDSRTMRGFSAYTDDVAPELISSNKLDEVFGSLDNGFKINILVAPTPIFGKPFVEYMQYGVSSSGPLVPLGIDSRYKAIRSNSTADKDGDGFPDDKKEKSFIANDREAWLFNEKSFAKVLTQLCRVESLVILSGDVHYAFTMKARIWSQVDVVTTPVSSQEKRCSIAQLVSSAAKNQTAGTRILRKTTAGIRWNKFGIWNADTQYRMAINTVTGKAYRPTELGEGNKLLSRTNLLVSYGFMPVRDERRNSERRNGGIPSQLIANPRLKASVVHQKSWEIGFAEAINVGFNNIGVVRFLPGLKVVHDILHRKGTSTRHEVDLTPISINEVRPGEEQ